MFNLIFGTIWTVFSSLFLLIVIIAGSSNTNGEPGFHFNPEMIIPILILTLFVGVGIFLMVTGYKKVKKDKNTKKFGLPGYGIIRDIKPTGCYVNEQPEFKASVDIINPETNQLETIDEVVGFNYNKYPINSYVNIKYYQGDINFEGLVDKSQIPDSIKDSLKELNYTSEVSDPYNSFNEHHNIVFSDDKEYVTIDGSKYKKIY